MTTPLPRLKTPLKGGFFDNPVCAALAVFFFALTCRVIFEDVLVQGEKITTDHLLSFGVLVGTFAAGHYFWPALKQAKLLSAFGFLVLFAAGTYYCVTVSASRNALVQLGKSQDAVAANNERESLKRRQGAAALEMERAEAVWTAAQEDANKADQTRAEKCDDGRGKFCRGAETNLKAALAKVDARKAEYDEKKKAAWDLDALIAEQVVKDAPPARRPTPNLLAPLPRVPAPVDTPPPPLALFVPFGKALFCEGATLIFAGFGFGHGSRTVRQPSPATVPQEVHTATVPPLRHAPGNGSTGKVVPIRPGGTVPQGPATVSRGSTNVPQAAQPKDAALELLRSHLASHRTVPQAELEQLFRVGSKSTVSRWLDEWEAAGIIVRTPSGRTKTVSLATRRWRVYR